MKIVENQCLKWTTARRLEVENLSSVNRHQVTAKDGIN